MYKYISISIYMCMNKYVCDTCVYIHIHACIRFYIHTHQSVRVWAVRGCVRTTCQIHVEKETTPVMNFGI